MKTPKKANRTPQSPQSTTNTSRLTVELPTEQAAPWLAMSRQERNEAAAHTLREFLRLRQCSMTQAEARSREDAVEAEFALRCKALDLVIETNEEPRVAVGRDRQTGKWFIVRKHGGLSVEELSLQETLREMARLHDLASQGYIGSTCWDDEALAALFTEAADAITLLRQKGGAQ